MQGEQNTSWWEEAVEGGKNTGSDFYEMKVGDNNLRILTKFEKVNQLFVGEYPNSKYAGQVDDNYKPKEGESVSVQGWAWGIDRATGDLKIFQFGRAILALITGLKNTTDFGFESFPMPYDVNIKNTGAGPARYSIIPPRNNTDITEDEAAALLKKKPVAEILNLIKNKQDNKNSTRVKVEYPKNNGEEIPF